MLTYSQEGPTIEGDVSFLSEKEWRDEIDVLLSDLIDEDGTVKRATDLRSDAGIAWSKVCAHGLRNYLDDSYCPSCMRCTRLSPKTWCQI
jgi:hypothetical protein